MIEPDRIVDGIARTLEESVLPALGHGFARGQLQAVLEVLGSLQGQLEWGGMLLAGEASMLVDLAAEAAPHAQGELSERLRRYAQGGGAPLGERLREGRELVCMLIESGLADEGPLASAVDSWLANDCLLKAMALRPSRLAEISKG